ncbi:PAS domain S-box-containing protein/diguanylate cyclase (GGDEF)-like protein [Azonexus fungiphilus]|uniref:PAS domain S-box-containing protein/diguanylate cyclase (GGDEF)-like protein n=1 Tax=Azonexus fungiphilus TaxID=146940 RepID=A0A495WFN4_9RHOO|nr:PAS domain S-box-containing protein/diguanylate cyclase (GGDEF)-like protein [Azonexus fungiphilus]
MTVARAPWSSSLQHPVLAVGLLVATSAALLFNALAPGPWSTLLLTTAGLATLWLGYAEYQHFRSISQAYQLAMQAAHDGFWNWNPLTKKLQVGSRLLQILGYREDFLPDTNAWLRLVHPDDRAFYNAAVARHLKGENGHFYCEYRVLASDGQYRWIASRGLAVRDAQGRAYLMVGSVTDITERHRHQEELEFLAQHDMLTGLPNRLLFAEHLQDAIDRARRDRQRLAVLFIDLDRFKNINDSLGHRAGDQMLQAVSATLRASLPAGCRLYRQGGDEFIVLASPLHGEDDVLAIALALKECITEPIKGGSTDFFTSASIGVSLFPDDADDGETLLRHADTAMYAAKSAGGNAIRLHTPQMDQRVSQRVSLENRLRQALQEDRLSLHFQAKVAAGDGRLVGAEALLRWQDGETMIPPDQFIPVAEECGLIVPIGEWVIARAVSQIAEWRHRYPQVPPIAINLSPRQFWRPSLAQGMLDALAAADLPTSALEVEITESVVLDPEGDGIEQLNRLRAAGIGIALDDFGTGYSSLSYLQRLPISVLKIDRSFIRPLAADRSDGDSEPLVRAIIAMAHSLSLQVVAEGVETPQQLQTLQALNCDILQGYLLSRPLPPGQFAEKFLVDR